MAGMKLKSLPLTGTWILGAAFDLSIFGHSVFRGGWSILVLGILFCSFTIYACGALAIALVSWSKVAWQRCLIIAALIVLFVPAIILGDALRERIFLAELPAFQKMTDLLISQGVPAHGFATVQLPPSFLNPLVSDHASIERGEDNVITVTYFTGDSSAVGHSGFLYRSDDNPEPLKKEHARMGFRRLAPLWYLWGA